MVDILLGKSPWQCRPLIHKRPNPILVGNPFFQGHPLMNKQGACLVGGRQEESDFFHSFCVFYGLHSSGTAHGEGHCLGEKLMSGFGQIPGPPARCPLTLGERFPLLKWSTLTLTSLLEDLVLQHRCKIMVLRGSSFHSLMENSCGG